MYLAQSIQGSVIDRYYLQLVDLHCPPLVAEVLMFSVAVYYIRGSSVTIDLDHKTGKSAQNET